MKGQDEIKKALSLCPGDSLECEQDGCPYWDIRLCVPELHIDALELLKEQDCNCCGTVFDVAYKAGKADAVVRCRDCDNQECVGRDNRIVCGITGEDHLPDWFCADGERKE